MTRTSASSQYSFDLVFGVWVGLLKYWTNPPQKNQKR